MTTDHTNNLDALCIKVSDGIKNGKQLIDHITLLKEYNGDDWKKYCQYCTKSYTRNKVYGDEYIDVFVICWNDEQASGVHDHPQNGCLLKVMCGELREDIYIKTEDGAKKTKTNIMSKDNISYKIGHLGLHNVINEGNKATSLHIYSPPKYQIKFYPMETCKD